MNLYIGDAQLTLPDSYGSVTYAVFLLQCIIVYSALREIED